MLFLEYLHLYSAWKEKLKRLAFLSVAASRIFRDGGPLTHEEEHKHLESGEEMTLKVSTEERQEPIVDDDKPCTQVESTIEATEAEVRGGEVKA